MCPRCVLGCHAKDQFPQFLARRPRERSSCTMMSSCFHPSQVATTQPRRSDQMQRGASTNLPVLDHQAVAEFAHISILNRAKRLSFMSLVSRGRQGSPAQRRRVRPVVGMVSPGAITCALSICCGKSDGLSVTIKSALPASAHAQNGSSSGSGEIPEPEPREQAGLRCG